MHYLIVATMRFMFATLILLGVGFFLLMGLLSILRELLADDHHPHQPRRSASDATAGFGHASD